MTEENTEEILKERKRKIKEFFLKKNFIFYLGLIILIIIAWQIRTSNVEKLKDVTTGGYTLGPDLDPFLFLRWDKYIVEHGSLMKNDTLRYVPLGYDTTAESTLLSYMMAYFHKAFVVLKPGISVDYSAVIFPAFMFLLTLIAFALMTRKIFENYKYSDVIALIAAAFLIFSPSLLSRTIAGIPEKESVGFLFMFLAFYFIVFAWKSEKLSKSLILGALAGISTGVMALLWGGWIYVLTSVAIAFLVAFFLGKLGRREFYIYFSWLFFTMFVPSFFFAERYPLKELALSTSSGLAFVAFLLFLTDIIVIQILAERIGFLKKVKEKYPEKVISIAAFIILVLILSVIVLGISFIPNFFKDIMFHLTNPYTDRLSFTVAENRQPYFDEWRGSFGPNGLNLLGKAYNIPPLFFWLFFIGSIALFYEASKELGQKKKWALVLSYTIFLVALIFSRYSQSSRFNGDNGISKFIYFGGFLYFVAVFVYLFYIYAKEKNLDELKKIDFGYLFIISFFVVSLIGARSAIRLIMALVPSAAVLAGFLPVFAFVRAKESKGELEKIIVWVLTVLVILATFYALKENYNSTYYSARDYAPSVYTQQWQKAMGWVRESTPKEAVFAHWWDYGYWLQSIGERATVLDGGNSISYWNHLIARHVLTSSSEEDALEFLYTHKVTHFLIDSTDIGKYPAYSNIGSDTKYDRYSYLPVISLNPQLIQETKNDTIFIYQAGFPLEDDFTYKQNNETKIFPAGKAGIAGVKLTISQDKEIRNAEIFMVYQGGAPTMIPLKCVYYNNKTYNFDAVGYNGCFYLVPSINQGNNGVSINPLGAGIFLGGRTKDTMFAKLFLFKEENNFDLVHSEDDFIVADLKSRGAIPQWQDFVVYGGIRGPIKIWQVNYPEGTRENPEYLKREYPPELQRAG